MRYSKFNADIAFYDNMSKACHVQHGFSRCMQSFGSSRQQNTLHSGVCVCVCVCACVCVDRCVCVTVHALFNCQYQHACIEIIAMSFPCTVLVDCKSHPCTNGGVCTVTAIGYKCACKDNYFGHNCQGEFLCYRAIYQVYSFP